MKCQGETVYSNIAAIELAMSDLNKALACYHLGDVFSMDETGSFYCLAPDRTAANRQKEGVNKIETRMTIALCVNDDGTENL